MANKRPTKAQIRARQTNILEGMAVTNNSFREMAKQLGVTPLQLRTFVAERKPAQIREQYNRSPTYRKLYDVGERKSVTRKIGHALPPKRIDATFRELERVRTNPLYSEDERRYRYQIGQMINNLNVRGSMQTPSSMWAEYCWDNNIPTSVKSIKLLYRNHRIDPEAYERHLTVWEAVYGINR
jgi:hypothetical protein